jgi:hypothetical protein
LDGQPGEDGGGSFYQRGEVPYGTAALVEGRAALPACLRTRRFGSEQGREVAVRTMPCKTNKSERISMRFVLKK